MGSDVTGPVVCFGEMLARLSPPPAVALDMATVLDLNVGGAEANVAAALASLGTKSRMVSALPDNPLGLRAKRALMTAGVDTDFLVYSPGRIGLYFFEQPAGVRAGRVTYDRSHSVFAEADPSSFDFSGALDGAALLHVSGITPALGPGGGRLIRAAIAAARDAAVPVCFDGNYRANLWDAWDSDPRAELNELVSEADLMFGNHRDISLLLGKQFSGDGDERRREAAEAAFVTFPRLKMIASTARHIVDATHHRIAARVDLRDGGWQTAELDVTGIVDRIGAGDAFAAGVLHRYVGGGNARAMAESGLALTALKHATAGDMILCDPAELDNFDPGGTDVRR